MSAVGGWRGRFAALLVATLFILGGCQELARLGPLLDAGPPTWSTRLADRLECDGPPSSLGAASDPESGGGMPGGASPEDALASFLEHEAPLYGFLPIEGWAIVERTRHWALAGHVVDGRVRAAASFTDAEESVDGLAWTGWQVAACDASEFDPAVSISYELVVWSDARGRIRTDRVLEAAGCAWRRLEVEGRAFVQDPDGSFGQDRLLDTYAEGLQVPADAIATEYREGDRRIWFAPDGRSAYVGQPAHADRWPRARGDDTSVTDCN